MTKLPLRLWVRSPASLKLLCDILDHFDALLCVAAPDDTGDLYRRRHGCLDNLAPVGFGSTPIATTANNRYEYGISKNSSPRLLMMGSCRQLLRKGQRRKRRLLRIDVYTYIRTG